MVQKKEENAKVKSSQRRRHDNSEVDDAVVPNLEISFSSSEASTQNELATAPVKKRRKRYLV